MFCVGKEFTFKHSHMLCDKWKYFGFKAEETEEARCKYLCEGSWMLETEWWVKFRNFVFLPIYSSQLSPRSQRVNVIRLEMWELLITSGGCWCMVWNLCFTDPLDTVETGISNPANSLPLPLAVLQSRGFNTDERGRVHCKCGNAQVSHRVPPLSAFVQSYQKVLCVNLLFHCVS